MQTSSRETAESCCWHLLLCCISFAPSIPTSFLVLPTLFTAGLTMSGSKASQPGLGTHAERGVTFWTLSFPPTGHQLKPAQLNNNYNVMSKSFCVKGPI